MCLDTVSTTYAEPSPEVIECYKVFDLSGENLVPFVYKYASIGGFKFPPEEWIEDTNKGFLHAEKDYIAYPIGFHAFLTERAARYFAARYFMECMTGGYRSVSAIRKVKLTEIVAKGRQGGSAVIVGRKMWIEP